MPQEHTKALGEAFELIGRVGDRRSVGWRTLALAFYEPTKEWVEALLDGTVSADLSEATGWVDSDRDRFSAALDSLSAFVMQQRGRDLQDVLTDLKVEYARLFIGAAGPMEAPPYESVYRDRDPTSDAPIVCGPSTAAVEQFYRRHGARKSGAHRDLPDHVATELEFMYFLSAKEAASWGGGKAEEAKELRGAQLRFLQEHLACWLPELCGKVMHSDRSGLYRAVAEMLREFLNLEIGTVVTERSRP